MRVFFAVVVRVGGPALGGFATALPDDLYVGRGLYEYGLFIRNI